IKEEKIRLTLSFPFRVAVLFITTGVATTGEETVAGDWSWLGSITLNRPQPGYSTSLSTTRRGERDPGPALRRAASEGERGVHLWPETEWKLADWIHSLSEPS